MRRRTIATSVVSIAATLAGLFAAMLFASSPAYAAESTQQVYLTYYGWYDNTPPGCAIAYPQRGVNCAGGTGTYADPISFASDEAEAAPGTIVYVPSVEKYFIMEDDCTECDQDWSGAGPDGGPNFWHFDLWTGGEGGNEFAAIDCEDALTLSNANGDPEDSTVIIDPPSNETVSSEPLFNTSTGACYGGAQPSYDLGTYQNGSTGDCLTDPGDSSSAGTVIDEAACNASASQNFEFNGAFFEINSMCIANTSGTTLALESCTGGADEQWEVNPNNTIDDMQTSTIYFCGDGSAVQASTSCSGSAEDWTFSGTTVTPGSGSAGPDELIGEQSGSCLDTKGADFTDNTVEEIWTCHEGVGQIWTYSDGTINIDSGAYCLTVQGASTAEGAATILYRCNGGANQQWVINSNGTITAPDTGYCLEAYKNGTANGTIVDTWACNGGENQQWSWS